MLNNNQLPVVFFETEDGKVRLRATVKDETIWLTQKMIAKLYDTDRSVIAKHLKNIFQDRELEENSVCAKFTQGEYDEAFETWRENSTEAVNLKSAQEELAIAEKNHHQAEEAWNTTAEAKKHETLRNASLEANIPYENALKAWKESSDIAALLDTINNSDPESEEHQIAVDEYNNELNAWRKTDEIALLYEEQQTKEGAFWDYDASAEYQNAYTAYQSMLESQASIRVEKEQALSNATEEFNTAEAVWKSPSNELYTAMTTAQATYDGIMGIHNCLLE
ncbi:MAG: hypothetical protein LBC04_02950 [Holosporaceae bacterium]|nr:hypothetical protein [Holosporaceae bacterium]